MSEKFRIHVLLVAGKWECDVGRGELCRLVSSPPPQLWSLAVQACACAYCSCFSDHLISYLPPSSLACLGSTGVC